MAGRRLGRLAIAAAFSTLPLQLGTSQPAEAHIVYCNYSANTPNIVGPYMNGFSSYDCNDPVSDRWAYTCLEWFNEADSYWATWGCGPGSYEGWADFYHEDDHLETCVPTGGGLRFRTWAEASNIDSHGWYEYTGDIISGFAWYDC